MEHWGRRKYARAKGALVHGAPPREMFWTPVHVSHSGHATGKVEREISIVPKVCMRIDKSRHERDVSIELKPPKPGWHRHAVFGADGQDAIVPDQDGSMKQHTLPVHGQHGDVDDGDTALSLSAGGGRHQHHDGGCTAQNASECAHLRGTQGAHRIELTRAPRRDRTRQHCR